MMILTTGAVRKFISEVSNHCFGILCRSSSQLAESNVCLIKWAGQSEPTFSLSFILKMHKMHWIQSSLQRWLMPFVTPCLTYSCYCDFDPVDIAFFRPLKSLTTLHTVLDTHIWANIFTRSASLQKNIICYNADVFQA